MALSKNNWGMLCHIAALAGFIGIPFGNILGPLVVWLVKRHDYSFVNSQGKESLNFQISMTIYGFIAWLLTFVFIGWILLPILVVVNIVLVIIAGVTASKGKPYRYPITIRLIK